MAGKHQYKVSSKRGRTKAGRKWRRQAKEALKLNTPHKRHRNKSTPITHDRRPSKPTTQPRADGYTVFTLDDGTRLELHSKYTKELPDEGFND